MNRTNRLANKFGSVFGSALIVAFAGCTTYVQQPSPPPTVYVPPPPVQQTPPPVVYAPPPAEPPVVVIRAETDFYQPLSPYGEWVVVGSYGRCWRPARVGVGWRPYCDGHWVRCDAGWYWASDEPWAWATYHYGRWDFSAQFGWFWVPQTQWAPAWVSWHEGGGYVGWAPLHPSARVSVSGSVEFNAAVISPRAFVFVEQRRFLEPVRPTTVVVNNNTVINKTVNITKVKVVNKTVINEGPRTEVVEQTSGRKVESVPVHELRRKDETEVVTWQRNIPSASDKKVQPPGRSASETPERRVVTPRETPQVGRPTDATPEQPSSPSAVEKRVPPAGRSESEAREKKVVPPRETRQVEKPTGTAKEQPVPTTKRTVTEPGEQKPPTRSAQPQVEKQGRKENRPESVHEAKPQAEQHGEIRNSKQPQAGKPGEAQVKSAKEKPGMSKQDEKNKKKRDEKKKGEEQETPPQQPAAPSRPPSN